MINGEYNYSKEDLKSSELDLVFKRWDYLLKKIERANENHQEVTFADLSRLYECFDFCYKKIIRTGDES